MEARAGVGLAKMGGRRTHLRVQCNEQAPLAAEYEYKRPRVTLEREQSYVRPHAAAAVGQAT